ncbi:DUF6883 domain-containing protein [Bradyrhizobium sp. CCBAU 51627]|uniref:DUF6883 domain-containing protein n=1 Tax=Bradyrhizobium sp. CCBAU 51627 TaxID=1325088 RepID=UPI003FA46117
MRLDAPWGHDCRWACAPPDMKPVCRNDKASAERRSGTPRYAQNRGLLFGPVASAGRHKARVFREALGLQRSDASWLRDALLEAAQSSEAFLDGEGPWGTHWRLDTTVRRQGKSVVVRTIWIIRTGERVPRFVTCWVL